jgi:hypothetical protein
VKLTPGATWQKLSVEHMNPTCSVWAASPEANATAVGFMKTQIGFGAGRVKMSWLSLSVLFPGSTSVGLSLQLSLASGSPGLAGVKAV